MENNSVLVTGGAGFIGSHLCERLLKENFKVICFDSLITGKKENISGFIENKNFKFVEGDITKVIGIDEKIDLIYNLASPASPVDYHKRPLETLYSGSIGVKHVLDLAKKNNARFLQASTSEVYGDPLEHPQKESYYGNVNPVGPRSCYDESKRFAEAQIVHFGFEHKIQYRIARIFNTYGPKMRIDDGRVIPNFITQALDKKPLTIYGDGSQTRSFCFVDDLVDGLSLLMNSNFSNPINIGNTDEFKVIEIADKIIEMAKSDSKKEFKVLPKDDPLKRKPDISLAIKELDWKPKVSLEEGLQKTIEWFKKQKQIKTGI